MSDEYRRPNNSLQSRILRNTLGSTLGYLLPSILFFITTPFVLNHLGLQLFGEWVILQSLEDAFLITDLGVSATIIKFVAEYVTRGEVRKANGIVGLALLYYGLIGLVSGTVIIMFSNQIAGAFGFISLGQELDSRIFTFTAFSVFFQILAQQPRAIVVASHRLNWVAAVELASRVVSTLLIILLLLLNFQLSEIVVGASILELVRMAIFFLLAHRIQPNLDFRPSFDLKTLTETFSFNLYSSVLLLSERSTVFGDRLMVGLIWGPQATSFYSVADRLAININSVLSETSRFLFPLSSSLTAQKDKEKLYRVFLMVSTLTALGGVALAFPLSVGAFPLLSNWYNVNLAENSSAVLQLQVWMYVFLVVLRPNSYFLRGRGEAKIIGVWGFLSSIFLFSLFLFTIPYFGFIGATYAHLTRTILNLLIYLLLIYPLIVRRPVRDFVRTMIPAALAAVTGTLIEYSLNLLPKMANLVSVLLCLAGYGIFVLVLGFILDFVLNRSHSVFAIWSTLKNQPMPVEIL